MENQEIRKELEEISPTLASLPKENNLDIPEGYFEDLSLRLLHGLTPVQKADLPEGYFNQLPQDVVQQLKTGKVKAKIVSFKTLTRFAAAATVAGLIGLGIFLFSHSKTATDGLSDSDSYTMREARDIIKNNTFDEKLNDLTDEDMIGYLEENGHDVPAALIASLSDENNLPTEEDFMSNENVLNEYLNQRNIQITQPPAIN